VRNTNNENLQPFTKENAKLYGKKGGKKSGQVRAEKKSIKEQLKILLEMPITKQERISKLKEAGFEENEINNQLYLTYTVFEKALTGDVKAISLVFKTIQNEDGEKSNSFNDALNSLFQL
jgi:hypothetical protein